MIRGAFVRLQEIPDSLQRDSELPLPYTEFPLGTSPERHICAFPWRPVPV